MSSVLRIALLAHNRFPISQPFAGGLEAHVWHLARALAERGHQVTLFAAEGSDLALDHPGLAVSALPRSAAASIPFPLPGAVKQSDHNAFVELLMKVAHRGTTRSFDVIHNHTLHYVPVMMAPQLNTPMLSTLHTPPLPLLEAAISATGGTGSTLAAVSRHTADAWGRTGVERLTVVPNGVDIAQWPAGLGGGYLVWSGRITPEKGPHLAMAAAAQSGLPLALAGPIVDADYFSRKIQPQLGNQTAYAGHLDQKRLATLVGGAAAALATPLWDEPYCLVVAEALSCGTPVVAFARGGIPELVDARCGRLVEPGDVAAMAAAIPTAIALPRAAVRDVAMTKCSAETMVSSYLRIYRDLIAEQNGSQDDRLLRTSPRTRAPRAREQHLRTPA